MKTPSGQFRGKRPRANASFGGAQWGQEPPDIDVGPAVRQTNVSALDGSIIVTTDRQGAVCSALRGAGIKPVKVGTEVVALTVGDMFSAKHGARVQSLRTRGGLPSRLSTKEAERLVLSVLRASGLAVAPP